MISVRSCSQPPALLKCKAEANSCEFQFFSDFNTTVVVLVWWEKKESLRKLMQLTNEELRVQESHKRLLYMEEPVSAP